MDTLSLAFVVCGLAVSAFALYSARGKATKVRFIYLINAAIGFMLAVFGVVLGMD